MKKITRALFIFFLIFSVTGCSSKKVAMIEQQFAEEIEAFQSQLAEAEKQVQKLSDEKNTLEKEIKEKESILTETTEQLNTLTDEHTELLTKYDENTAKLSETTDLLDNIATEKEKISAELEETSENLNRSTQKLTELQEQASEKDQALDEAAAEIDALSNENDDLKSQLDKANNEINELSTANTSLQNTIAENEQQIEETSGALEALKIENEALQTQIDDNLNTITEHTRSNTTLQDSLSEKDGQLEEKDILIGKLNSEKEELEAQLDEKNSSIKELTGSNAELQNAITEKEQALADASAAIDALKFEKETLQSQINDIMNTANASVSTEISPEHQITETNQMQTTANDNTSDITDKASANLINMDNSNEESFEKEPAADEGETPIEQEVIEVRIKTMNGVDMVYVPADEFTPGSDNKEASRLDNYWITRTEITNAQYKECADAGTCVVTDLMDLEDITYADYPATYVTYRQAQRYCSWLGGALPNESQWEKAARGNNNRIYPWGDEEPTIDNLLANIPGLTYDLTPVGSFEKGASPYGALDMAGNAWEWVSGTYTPESEDHVIRGGSAAPAEEGNYLESLQTTYRGHAATPNYYIGFRCVLPDGIE